MENLSTRPNPAHGTGSDPQVLRIELGGGHCPKDGFLNLDLEPQGHGIACNLNERLPLEDDSVSEVYSSHCLEHIENVTSLLREICRVCVVGATVTIKVPHHGQEMAMCPGHHHVISEKMVDHFDEFPQQWWTGNKRLTLQGKQYTPTEKFRQAKKLFPRLNDLELFTFIQNTCHEVIFIFKVEPHDRH